MHFWCPISGCSPFHLQSHSSFNHSTEIVGLGNIFNAGSSKNSYLVRATYFNTISIGLSKFGDRNAKKSFTSVIIGSAVHIRLVRTHTSLRGQVYTLIICPQRLGVHNPTAVRNYTVKMLDLTMQKLLWFLAFMNRAF